MACLRCLACLARRRCLARVGRFTVRLPCAVVLSASAAVASTCSLRCLWSLRRLAFDSLKVIRAVPFERIR